MKVCNGTAAGLGYEKVGVEWSYNTPSGQWICYSTFKLEDVDDLNDQLQLDYAYHDSDTALLETLLCGSQVQIPVREEGKNFPYWL